MDGSECQGLGPTGDLGVPVVAQRLDRGAGQRLVLPEQPVESLLIAEAAVPQHGEQPRQVLEDGAVLQEVRGDLSVAAARDGHELAVAQELADPVGRRAQELGRLRGGERVHRVRAYGERRTSGQPGAGAAAPAAGPSRRLRPEVLRAASRAAPRRSGSPPTEDLAHTMALCGPDDVPPVPRDTVIGARYPARGP